MLVDAQLQELLHSAAAAVGFELWGAEQINSGNSSILRVYIDKKNGVSIDDCEKVSHQINSMLEVENKSYALEVSSPGVNRPLFTLEHYRKYVGEEIKLRLKHADELNRKNFTGNLMNVDGDNVVIEVDGESHHFNISDIAKAHLNPNLFMSKSKAK